MNNVFNPQRFGRVLGKDIQENWKSYCLQILGLFGALAILLIIQSNSLYRDAFVRGYDVKIERSLFSIICPMFSIYVIMLASTLMAPMLTKTSRISYLSLPASNLEKFLSRWLILAVGSIVVFSIALWLADLLRVAVFSFRYPEHDVHLLDFSKLVCWDGNYKGSGCFFADKYAFYISLSALVFFQSLCALGSTFWAKNSILKTFAATIVIVGLYFLMCRWAVLTFYDNLNQFGDMLEYYIISWIPSPKEALKIFCSCLFFTALVNWVIAFFRFRESEIIKRL